MVDDRLGKYRFIVSGPQRMAFHAEKKRKKQNKTKHRNTKMAERRTTNTTHPGLLRLLSNEDIVLAGPVHRHVSRGEEGLEG